MLDFRIMIKFKKKENINNINISIKTRTLFNAISDEYTPVEIVYENYINLFNRKNEELIFWNIEYDDFYQLLIEFQKNDIIKFND